MSSRRASRMTHPDLIDTPNYAGGNRSPELTGDVSHDD